ncbi:hypothetical protein L208DRAFT_1543034 [Tricholoma matsutake]|nr:hypothetical protein L208DRAFT_1543034 [Tricholoma matsutake 945]
MKEVGVLLNHVPYVRVLAGVIVQIINIKGEIQASKERCHELIDKVLRRSTKILDGLLKVALSPRRNQLMEMKAGLDDYKNLLVNILKVLKKHASKSFIDQVINWVSRLDDLNRYNRLIDDFNTDFMVLSKLNSLDVIYFLIQLFLLRAFVFKPILPPQPVFMVGRDKEKSDVLATVLNTTQANIAILGAGGMGKTTLALFILHDPQVVDKYCLRYFVSCEAVSSLVVLLGEIANALWIPRERRDEHLYDTVLTALQKEVAILCLDNLETVWDTTAHQEEIEGFLSQIGSIPVLTLLVTMQGTQRPSGVFWSKPLLSPLTGLDLDKMFQPVDQFVDRLLRAMDGIPLAIMLIASLLQEGNESSKSLWTCWEKAHTKVVELGGRGRMSNLDASIHLSLYSPRMMADKHAIDILAMLSLLPDGFPDAGIKDLQSHLSADIDLSKLVQTLKRVSLVYTDQAMESNQSRLHILSPVRYFCQGNIKIPQGLRSSLMTFYIQMLSNNADWSDHTSHMIVPPELLNIHSVFLQAWKAGQAEESLVVASVLYTHWSL